MSAKEKIIKRINDGFGFNIPLDAKFRTHQAMSRMAKEYASQSWFIMDEHVPFDLQLGCCRQYTNV